MIYTLIPARGGSKRLPNKNIRFFCKRPLIYYTVQKCLSFSDVFVSSDDEQILEIATSFGAIPIRRPAEISGDSSIPKQYLKHFFEIVKNIQDDDVIALCQCTSPNVPVEYYHKGLKSFKTGQFDSVISVSLDKRRRWQGNQQIIGNSWVSNDVGAFYFFNKLMFMKKGTEVGKKVGFVEIPRKYVADIDTLEDFEIAEMMYERYNK